MKKHHSEKESWYGYGIVVGLLHVIGISFLIIGGRANPMLYGMGFICYTLGLRHAFDADHIAAIDNTVRKLIQQKKKSMGVGFYFSLGHSSVVCVMALVTVLSVHWAEKAMPELQQIGGMVGTIVSGCFLILIGILNLIILKDLFGAFSKMRNGKYDKERVEKLLLSRGLMGRFFSPLFKLINESWHVYPLGFLFGLGFDTASEVALIAISATAAHNTYPVIGLLSFPFLFAAGMSAMDTADGVFMVKTYNWAFATPLRKVYYNITITAVSVAAALLIGCFELIQIIGNKLGLKEGFWGFVQQLNLGWLGYLLVALFLFAWLISFVLWKLLKIEKRWQSDIS